MEQSEIIRMAREAGFVAKDVNGFLELKLCHPTPRSKSLGKMFKRFAALVAAHEKKFWMEQIEVECNETVLAEREACAQVCETDELCCKCGDECAAAIRAMGCKLSSTVEENTK